jgi:uncharacterized protein YjdB
MAVIMTVLSACGGGGGGGSTEPVRTVTSVTVTSPTQTVKQGDTVQLTAVARDQFGAVIAGNAVTWSSSVPSVATVSSTGLLQALTGGTVVVTGTISGVSGTLALIITPRVTTTVTVSSPTASPTVGEMVQLTVVARDQFGDTIPGKTATWATSDARVATISSIGLLQAVAPGAVMATATIDGVPGSLTLTVVPGTVALVTVSAPTLTPKEGDAVQLTAVARDQFGNIVPGVNTTWSVSDATLAAVSASGLLQTYATGTVLARATVASVTGEVSLTVSAIKVAVTFGAKEVVFDYTTDRCEELDLPDGPARVVRAEDGSLVLFATDAPRNYLSRGANFDSLKRDCSQPALESADLATPDSYENQEWLWSAYREGNRWHALIHNEFHDPIASTCKPGDTTPANPCWYNSITYAVSTDGARSFRRPPPPTNVVAPAPDPWVAPSVPVPPGEWAAEGYRNPTNIVRAADGYLYSFFNSITRQGVQGLCAMRTNNLDDPASWRAWDGNGFNLRMASPYVTGTSAPPCISLDMPLGMAHLVYNSYLQRYMAVQTGERYLNGRLVCGFYFALSADLVHWSQPQLLVETWWASYCSADPNGPGVLEPVPVSGASIVDHADTTINFEKAGQTPYLYYIRFNDGGLDRDLVRAPLTFNRVD